VVFNDNDMLFVRIIPQQTVQPLLLPSPSKIICTVCRSQSQFDLNRRPDDDDDNADEDNLPLVYKECNIFRIQMYFTARSQRDQLISVYKEDRELIST
jgi:hypothetical protein